MSTTPLFQKVDAVTIGCPILTRACALIAIPSATSCDGATTRHYVTDDTGNVTSVQHHGH
ncbi:MAG TPA: hypothetical protein VH641_06770 [Streptosporangiaceae bacterium]|jgi:hypothetical protein